MTSLPDSEDDSYILVAAGKWATEIDNDNQSIISGTSAVVTSEFLTPFRKRKNAEGCHGLQPKSTSQPIPDSLTKKYSLHLTKVPFDATQSSIRFAFGERGCNVTSVRLVFDHDRDTNSKRFRGVAFVDLADEESFRKGLQFHRMSFLGKGRKVNVRPTRSKRELSEIARQTEVRVANLIKRRKLSQSNKSHQQKSSNKANATGHDEKKNSKKRKRTADNENEKESEVGRGRRVSHQDKLKEKKFFKEKEKTSKVIKEPICPKLSKKQRAKKAGVIRMLATKS